MSNPFKRNRFNRKLGIESLESRQLFAVLSGSDDLTLATQAVALHHYTESYLGQPIRDRGIALETTGALLEALKPHIEDYWRDFFGKTPQQALEVKSRTSAVLDVLARNSILGNNFSSTAVTSDGFLYSVNDLYSVNEDGNLSVIDATNANEPSKQQMIPGTDSYMSVLVDGNRLVTLESTGNWLLNDQWQREYGLQTKISAYDITDRANPSLISTSVVDGVRSAAQLKSGKLTLVVRNYPNIPEPALLANSQGSYFESAIEYENRVGTKLLDAILPAITIQTATGVTLASTKIGSSKDLALTPGSIARASTVMRLDINSAPKVLASETLIGRTDSNIVFDQDDVYLVGSSVVRVHTRADGELIADASNLLPGSVISSRFMDASNGVLRVVSYDSNETYVTTFGNTNTGWGKLGQLTLPNTYPVAASFSDGMALIEVWGANDKWLQVIDMKDPASPREMGRQFSQGLSQVLGIGSEKFIVSTYDTDSFQLSLYAVNPSGDLMELDRWQSTDGNAGGQNGVVLDFAEGKLTANYKRGPIRAIRLFDLESTLYAKLSNSASYFEHFMHSYQSDVGAKRQSSYPTVPVVTPVDSSNRQRDINADGFVTALDVLMVINFINKQPTAVKTAELGTDGKNTLDINGDGDITALDVLTLLNAINLNNQTSQLSPMLEDIEKRKAKS